MARQTKAISGSSQDNTEQIAPEAEVQPAPDTAVAPAEEAESGTGQQAAPAIPPAPVDKPCSCQSDPSSLTFDCNPCSDPIATANRVIRDPNVSHAVSELLGVAAQSAAESKSPSIPKGVHRALEGIAKAFAGKDAVAAKGEGCAGQLRLFFELQDPVTGKRTPLDPQLSAAIGPRLIDENFHLAATTSTFDGKSYLFSRVEPKQVRVSLPAEIIAAGEISPHYEVKLPGDKDFQHYQNQTAPVTGSAAATVILTSDPNGDEVSVGEAITFTAALTPQFGWPAPSGTVTFNSYLDDATGGPLSAAPIPVQNGIAVLAPAADALSAGLIAITATYSGDANYAPANSNPLAIKVCDDGQSPGVDTAGQVKSTAANKKASAPQVSSRSNPPAAATVQPILTSGYMVTIPASGEAIMKLILRPPAAHVRCFSWLDGEGAGCLPGNQYISRVAISATQGDNFIACKPTSDSGCSGFKLNPGWYNFSAPEDITIEGCSYELASSSPVSAFLGAGQSCSDIFFRYKKKGSHIEVISEVLYPDPGNPFVKAKNVFAGMEYLLLRENDPSFVQQQTAADGSPVSFRNLTAGPYLLFCQAPATYGSQPVQPVYPAGGRLALTVFGGQTSAVPVQVKFKTGTTAPAVLDGYVRDDTGMPIVGQVVQIVNCAGCIVAAGVTDATGQYSIQMYTAEDVTIVVGTQQIAVSKAQIQAAMKTVGTPALPSPNASLDLAMQTADVLGLSN